MIPDNTPIGTVIDMPWGLGVTIGQVYKRFGDGELLVKVRIHGQAGSAAYTVPCFMAHIHVVPAEQLKLL
jgi:hypothetical protein